MRRACSTCSPDPIELKICKNFFYFIAVELGGEGSGENPGVLT